MRKEKKMVATLSIIAIIVASLGYLFYYTQTAKKDTLVISTTTSLYDTGLLDEIKTTYEAENPRVILAFISAGTGIALENARRGDADLILVHSPSQEYEFMQEGYGVNRKIFAYNFFTIVGPSEDPVGIYNMSPLDALSAILKYGRTSHDAIWVSRDDGSGTNTKEKALWSASGFNYSEIQGEDWFVSSGSGMGTTLNLANERGFYTLSDIGTYLKYKSDGLITLEQMVEEGESLLNVYSVIAVNAERISTVKYEAAMDFVRWLVGESAQNLIANYGHDAYNASLFSPAVTVIKDHSPSELYQWIQNYAFFESGGVLYECPPEWRNGDYGLYN